MKHSEWIFQLEDEDITFIRNFILASGSLKELASQYGTTYHMVRNRLNALIRKVTPSEARKEDPYISYIKSLALEDSFSYETAKILIEGYKERIKQNEE